MNRLRLLGSVLALVVAGLAVAPVAQGAFPGTNGKIVFISDRDGNPEVFTMNPDGSGQSNLSNNAATEFEPAWSADGTKIAFVSNRDGNNEIYTMNADGGGVVRVTNNSGSDRNPAWTPDGRILYTSTRDGDQEIFIVSASGGAETQLTNNAVGDVHPVASPNGSRIAFASDRDGNFDIFTMGMDGGSPMRLTDTAATELRPDWSPDGSRIVFQSDRDGPLSEIYVMGSNGDGETRLTENAANDTSPVFSPDGGQIALSRDTGNNEVFTIGSAGGGGTNRTNDPKSDITPDWQPAAPFPTSSTSTSSSSTSSIPGNSSTTSSTPGNSSTSSTTPTSSTSSSSTSSTSSTSTSTSSTVPATTTTTVAPLRLTPRNSSPAGGRVTITGTGLGGASVLFGDVEATDVTVNQDGTQIEATAPAHDAGLVEVTVNAAAGALKARFGYSEGVWEPTGNLGTGRYAASMGRGSEGHTATLLRNGKVLVVGGCDTRADSGSCRATAATEIYDPATGRWLSTGSLAGPRRAHTATLLGDGRVLVTGGFVDTLEAMFDSAEIYDPATGTWTTTAGHLSVARTGHTATLLPNGNVLVAGGRMNDVEPTPTVDLYDPNANTWTATGSLEVPRTAHTATLLNDGKVLVLGGLRADAPGDDQPGQHVSPTTTSELYDPATGKWTTGRELAAPRNMHTATKLPDGTVLVAGGENGILGGLSNSIERYDPSSGSRLIGRLQVARGGHAASLLPDGRVLLAGNGIDQAALSRYPDHDDTSEVVDPATGRSTFAGLLSEKASAPAAVTLAPGTGSCDPNCGKVLLVGGWGSTPELYTAGVPYVATDADSGSGDDTDAGGSTERALNLLARTGGAPLGLLRLAAIALAIGLLGRRVGQQSRPARAAAGHPAPVSPARQTLSGLGLGGGRPSRRTQPRNAEQFSRPPVEKWW